MPSPMESIVGNRNQTNWVENNVSAGNSGRQPVCSCNRAKPNIESATNATAKALATNEAGLPGIPSERKSGSLELPV